MSEEYIRVLADNSSKARRAGQKIMSMTVRALAFRVIEKAGDNIQTEDLIDTGALINSRYVDTVGELGREKAIAAATEAGKTPGRKSGKTNDFTPGQPYTEVAGPYQARAAIAAAYGAPLEEGTDRGIKAKPFFGPAVEAVKGEVATAAKNIADEVLRGA